MKIIDVKCHALQAKLEKEVSYSMGWYSERAAAIVEIATDEGIVGWGESLCHARQPPQVAKAIVEHFLKPALVGMDPFDVEVLWEEMYSRTRAVGQQGIIINAMSGVDIALWDIIGKALQKPIHKLIGGAFRTSVQAYATGFYRSRGYGLPDAIAEARRHIGNGFKGFKLKTGFGVQEDIDYIHGVREAVGDDVLIMADANCAYNAATARRILLACEDAKLHFFEEPLPPEDIEGYKELKTLSPIYIASGENIFTKIGYRNWIAEHALDIIQPDLCSSGGFTELKKIAALAQAYSVMMVPHVWGSGIGLAASLQFVASIPPMPLSINPVEPMLEYDCSAHPFRHDLIFGAINMTKDGRVPIPTGAGIGVEVNRAVIERFQN
jgi:D-galactarolactone cycloisomerase